MSRLSGSVREEMSFFYQKNDKSQGKWKDEDLEEHIECRWLKQKAAWKKGLRTRGEQKYLKK